MNVTDIQNTINLSLPVATYNYIGTNDVCGIRNGFGIENWKQDWQQNFNGHFYNDCLHTYGTYEWIYDKEKYSYDGKIYANNLEGYGLLSYPNGNFFEGLFKYNQRYGPGVLTYADGSQDVGIWNGQNLIRLSSSVRDHVPNLSKSLMGKIYLAHYKKLISLSSKPVYYTDRILDELKASEKLRQDKIKLCNSYTRNPKSVFFDKENFDTQYFSDENEIVDVVLSIKNGKTELHNKAVDDILAWNNEEESIEIMKHSFLHRKYENILSFSINAIIVGERENFKESGILENKCKEFLNSCYNGEHRKISQLITDYDLNPDLCDLIGNSGIHSASSNNHRQVIKVLVNFGANLDRLNDEGLTPLLLCLLKYIEVKEKVKDWEKAFLPEVDLKNTYDLWRPNLNLENIQIVEDQLYILDIKCKHPLVLAKKGKKEKKIKEPKVKKENDKKGKKKGKNASKIQQEIPAPTPEEIQAQIEKDIMEEQLKEISQTINLLLFYGCDPNFGEVPLPPLILSIFTKEDHLIEELIKQGADCNITTSYHDGSLTPLHIVTALKPSPESKYVAEKLLSNGAYKNPRTNSKHWLEEKQTIDPEALCDDDGKTPLHLLSMRFDFVDDTEDFLGDLYAVLVKNGADPNQYYLGHTCLSLAILRGNLKLINRILESYEVDPNQYLGCNMGVPLTVLILKRYKCVLPINICKSVYELLNTFNANPYNSLPAFEGNCIEFCEEENKEEEIPGKKKKKEKKKKDPHSLVLQCFMTNAQQVLERNIKAKAVKYIYEYKIECDFVDKIFDAMVAFLEIEDTVKIIQIFLNNNYINYHVEGILALLKYVEKKPGVNKKDKKKEKNKSKKGISIKTETLDEIVQEIVIELQPKRKINAPQPEVDPDEEKYEVCFNCYKKTNKILVLCPSCELVYFCSEECNKISVKKVTIHKCKGIFYGAELKKMLEREKLGKRASRRLDKFKQYREQYFSDPANAFNIKYGFGNLNGSTYSLTKKDKHKQKKEKDKKSKRHDSSKTDSKTDVKKKKKGKHKTDESSDEGKSKKGGKKNKSKKGRDRSKSPKSKSKDRDRSKHRSRSQTKRDNERDKSMKSKSKSPKTDTEHKGGGDGADDNKEDRPTLGSKINLLQSEMSGLLHILSLNKSFLPCCVLINGQLFYKFGEGNTFCGLSYSHI